MPEIMDCEMSSIYINPNEISVNMQTNRFSLVKPTAAGNQLASSVVQVVDTINGEINSPMSPQDPL